jgi:hypothetical protein
MWPLRESSPLPKLGLMAIAGRDIAPTIRAVTLRDFPP